jgi:hypothetical protein
MVDALGSLANSPVRPHVYCIRTRDSRSYLGFIGI